MRRFGRLRGQRVVTTCLAVVMAFLGAGTAALAAGGRSPGRSAQAVSPPVSTVQALPTSWTRGVDIVSYETDPFDTGGEGMLASLKEAAADGANYVAFVPDCSANDIYATALSCTWDSGETSCSATDGSGPTVSDACLTQAISDAKSLGLKVALYPHVDPGGTGTRSEWAPTSDDTAGGPSDWPDWWSSYDAVIEHYAALGQADGVSLLYVGSEMNTADVCDICTTQWDDLISAVRGEFSGELSYAADVYPLNSDTPDYVNFPAWDKLDAIGIDAYFPLQAAPGAAGAQADPSVAQLAKDWDGGYQDGVTPGGNDLAELNALASQYGKPVIASEYGAGDSPYAASDPSSECNAGACGTDPTAQADLYSAFFDAFAPQSWFDGGFFWNFQTDRDISPTSSENADGQVDPRGLSAEQVLKSWWTATTSTTTTTGPVESIVQQIIALLTGALDVPGSSVKLGALIRGGGYRVAVNAPEAGTLTVRWSTTVHHRAVTVAAGSRSFTRSGSATLKLALTRSGRTLLSHAGRIRLTERASFAPRGSRAATRTGTLTLQR